MSGGTAEEVMKIVRWMAAVCWSLRTVQDSRFTCLSMHHTGVLLFRDSVTGEVPNLVGCVSRQLPVFLPACPAQSPPRQLVTCPTNTSNPSTSTWTQRASGHYIRSALLADAYTISGVILLLMTSLLES